MLDLRPCCEACGVPLSPDSPLARICSFECTFCAECAEVRFKGVCPNCGGNFVPRPIRPPEKLVQFPAAAACIPEPRWRIW
ncbi:MAG: DUF1272 domain-containing protein [Armatimonadetes bacterium]|nr:DUF1272 domain-containing protein [Armatimonadota bacterium]